MKNEGFEISRVCSPGNKNLTQVESTQIVIKNPHSFIYQLSFPEYLVVEYKNEPDDIKYQIDLRNAQIKNYYRIRQWSARCVRARKPESESDEERFARENASQISWLRLKNQDSVTIDANGALIQGSENVLFSGYWFWESPAEWLPIDYKPKKNDQ